MKIKILILTVSLFAFFGKANGQYCTNDNRYTEVAFFDSTEITIGKNIQYGIASDFHGNPTTLLMDLYYPNQKVDKSPKRPFILLAHGGAFQSGDKQQGDIKDLCSHLAKRGFVTASINYRLGKDNSEYDEYKARYRAIQDGHAALRYVVNNANEVRVDTSWIFVGGQSAGSALALGLVYADQVELDSLSLAYSTTAISVQLGNLHTSGNNLTNKYSIKGIFNNWGGVIDSEVDIDEMIPTIAFHGELDPIVIIDADNSSENFILNGSRAMHNKLIAKNICSEITIDTKGDHGIFRNASSLFRAQRASCFFKSVFCKTCSNFYTTDSIPSNCSTPQSVDEYDYGSNLKVYPNPFETSFRIDNLDGLLELTIYNCLNQLVYKNHTVNGVAQIDLKPGIYFLNVKQVESNKAFTTKLIKN